VSKLKFWLLTVEDVALAGLFDGLVQPVVRNTDAVNKEEETKMPQLCPRTLFRKRNIL
jgi:hypothetical protein